MIVQNSIHAENFFEFQYEFVNLQSGFDLTSKLYDIVTESSQKENFIVRLKNAVVNIIKKFINFLKGIIFKEKQQSKTSTITSATSSKSQSSSNNKTDLKDDNSAPNTVSVPEKQKLRVENYGSDVFVVDTDFIEKELTGLFNSKDEIFKRHEEIVDKLIKMDWRDDEMYDDPCFDEAQEEMQHKITIKDDFFSRYDSNKFKVISNYEVDEKDYDRIHDLHLKYDKLYFRMPGNSYDYKVLDFYESLQDKSKELLKYTERALSNKYTYGDQAEKMKIMFQYANFIIQKYNEMVYIAMFLKNKMAYNMKVLDQLNRLILKY